MIVVDLTTRKEIAASLKLGPGIFADIADLPPRLPIHNVRLCKDNKRLCEVLVLEGWRLPKKVYREYNEEFEQRAAIMEYHGGLSQAEAEERARELEDANR